MPWRPLLQGARAAGAEAAIARLSTKGSRRRQGLEGPGLGLGAAGIALMHAYVGRLREDAAAMRRARRSLNGALRALERQELNGTLSNGLPGIAWVMAHLDREGLVEADQGLAADLDRSLLGAVRGKRWKGELDLLSGLVGFGAVALERLPRPDAWRTLERVVHHLGATAERAGAGMAWPSHDWTTGERVYYLGVAHGVAGVIGFLARMVELGVSPRPSRRLLDAAVALLLDQELPEGVSSRFPLALVPGKAGEPCRSAWCHGDLGIATQLLLAARMVREPAWERVAIRVARDVAARPFEADRDPEPALCHGSLGTAHLLNRMYQATGDAPLRRGALRRLEHGLQMWRAAQSGGQPYHHQGKRGLLLGDAGMALALLAATTAVEPGWDRWMSVSTTPTSTM